MNKRLKKTIEMIVDQSFDAKNNIKEVYVNSVIITLKSLPNSSAIIALELYAKGLKRRISVTNLKIETAVTLSGADVQEIVREIKEKYPVNNIETKVTPGLLGGLKMQIGDIVYNDTLSNRVFQVKGAIIG